MFASASALAVAAAVAAMIALPVLSPDCGGERTRSQNFAAEPVSLANWGSEWNAQHGHYGPAWGYDGDDLVIVFRWSEGRRTRGGSLYTVREDGTNLTLLSPSVGDGNGIGGSRIAYDTSPAVSPDGTRVAYATLRHSVSEGRLDIVTAALDGTEREQLTRDRESQHEPSWSPDGARIAFLWRGALHTMAADGSDVRNLAGELWAVPEPPPWSPDGTRLAFRESVTEDLYVVGADGSNLTRVAEGPLGRPAWSPDGRLAFVTGVEVGEGRFVVPTVPPANPVPRGERSIVVMDADGSNREVLLEGGYPPLLWSPDGTEVLAKYIVQREGPDAIGVYAISVDGEHAMRLVAETGMNEILRMAWSPDGTRLALLMSPSLYASGGRRTINNLDADVVLYTIKPDGSDRQVLVREDREGKLEAADGKRP